MQVAEDAREDSWLHPSFCENLFGGSFKFDLIYPFPEQSEADHKIGTEHVEKILKFLEENLDPLKVDEEKKIPEHVVKGLGEMGYMGIKIPKEYGGLELSQTNYNRIIAAVGSYCASTAVLLSAHQSIGVPQPLKQFGTPEQKKKYLTRCAKGEVSAFALTEEDVGSDPAQMGTTAKLTEDGKHYILNGRKLWCTNGTMADLYVVMASTTPKKFPDGREKKQVSAFIVERDYPGVNILHRCDFMGLKGIENGLIEFDNVKVPKENLLWEEGKGLKLALITLNTGRLTLPAASAGGGRVCFEVAKTWAGERKQWGAPIGMHESTAHRVNITAAATYCIDAVSKLTSGLADLGKSDLRIEAAVAKLFSTGTAWRIIDNTLQVRGGRGFETAQSLKARGEDCYPIEKLMRDSRINTIIEGTSNIQRLFISREALDRHLKIAGNLFSPRVSIGEKVKTVLFKAIPFYAIWFPKLFLNRGIFHYWQHGWAGSHLRFIHNTSRRLARRMFIAMVLNGPGLEKKQITLGRIVDTGSNLFVMAAVLSMYLTRQNRGALRTGETLLAKQICSRLKGLTKRSYSSIRVWPGKSSTLELSKKILAGELDWITEDICDVVRLSRADGTDFKVQSHGEPKQSSSSGHSDHSATGSGPA